MNFHIKLEGGTLLASFEEGIDRDLCIEVFRDRYPDCEFDAVDGEIDE